MTPSPGPLSPGGPREFTKCCFGVLAPALGSFLALIACDRKPPPEPHLAPSAGLLPGASASASASSSTSAGSPASTGPAPLLCPAGMVAIPSQPPLRAFCIDAYEAHLVDKKTGVKLSPYYPPHPKLAVSLAERWEKERREVGGAQAQEIPLPPLPAFQREGEIEFMAVSKAGEIPSGYLSGYDAERACRNAGKRLCRYNEWLTACQGRQKRQFPYGDSYQPGACNICRTLHP
ncbi:MAG: hypothetical protein RMJ98_05645, partial [Myxococcales bacterium]|nr:hypothetical protein [Polyangiaceae bacterium]MDW8248775.1 hypothetical protein [Myxococcales bacterium]